MFWIWTFITAFTLLELIAGYFSENKLCKCLILLNSLIYFLYNYSLLCPGF